MKHGKMGYRQVCLIVMTVTLCSVNIYTAQAENRTDPKVEDAVELNETTATLQNHCGSFPETVLKLQQDTKLVFAEVEEAKVLLTTRGTFINSLSSFDRSARMKTDKYVSEKEFLEHIAEQVSPWTDEEKRWIKSIVKSVSDKLSRFKLNFPQKILLIKTTGKEEGNAAYCRSGAIVLPQDELSNRNPNLENTIIHELFHITSSNNPELKRALYEVIHFKKCNDIKLPDTLRHIKTTNPDAPTNDHYIELQYSGEQVQVVPIIYSSAPKYDVRKGGEFFHYLTLKLLVIEKVGDNWQFKDGGDGTPILLDVREVPDYFNKIGANTGCIIHPEEILAENFVLVVQEVENLESK